MIEKTSRTLPGSEYWLDSHSVFLRHLIVRHENNQFNLLTLPTREGEVLPVFSTELAALAFLRLSDFEADWHVRESTAGELISLLMGHMEDADLVTVDPPSTITTGELEGIELADKRDFISSLMREPLLMSTG